MQNNEIEVIEGLKNMKKLQKLYIDGNHISVVGGLEECARLEELHINRCVFHEFETRDGDNSSSVSLWCCSTECGGTKHARHII